MTEAIQVEGLIKVFTTDKDRPPLRAMDGIDFTVHEGEVFGLLDPNGTGKTTTIRMLTGLARLTSGQAHLLELGALAAFSIVLFLLAVRTLG